MHFKRTALMLALLLTSGAVSVWAQGKIKAGEVRPYNAQTPSPYPSSGSALRTSVWTDRVVSPGATFVRVHFSQFDLAPGDYVTVSSKDGSQSWTYTGKGPRGTGEFWAFAVDGDEALISVQSGNKPGKGYKIDSIGHGTIFLDRAFEKKKTGGDPIPEVVCGTDGREDMACHAELDALSRPVARLLFQSGGSMYVCTGWLATGPNNSTMVTNNHCFATQRETNSVQASFNFQRSSCGGATNNAVSNYNGGTFLKTNAVDRKGTKGGLDYTIFTLLGNPEATWGELTPTRKESVVNDLIYFIQHPGGNEKKIGYWEDGGHTARCNVDATMQTYGRSEPNSQTAYACDSEGGSSGSPIHDVASGRVIALHHFGGVGGNTCMNSATRMSRVCADAGSLLTCATN